MLHGQGKHVVVFERGGIGAAWTTRYDRLHLHTVRWLSCLPGCRMPRALGKWPSRDAVIEYLRRYAERTGVAVRTGTEVQRIDRDTAVWNLVTSGGDVQAERVVVATGHSNVPFVPDWPGTFDGEIVHSASYRNPAPYIGRRVLVVGAGNSGAEIAADVADGGADVPRRAHTPEHRPARHARFPESAARHCDGSPAGGGSRSHCEHDAAYLDPGSHAVRAGSAGAAVLGVPAPPCDPDSRCRFGGGGPERPRPS
jgi:cation diffusion facilitator CzcD-associated flavoprotein CzcO